MRALVARLEQHLEADAHGKRRPAAPHPGGERGIQARLAQAGHGRAEAADPGQHDVRRILDHRRVLGEAGARAEPHERRAHRGEVRRAGRHHDHLGRAHSTPFVLGT